MKKIGINDIASYLNISRNTVSKVMNDRGKVSEKVREKVIQAAVELDYRKLPKHLRIEYEHTLKEGRTSQKFSQNILVLATSPDFSTFWGNIINGITKELANKGFTCLYNFLTFEQEKNFELPQIIKEGDIAGIIVMNVYKKEAVEKLARTGIPIVYFDIPLEIDVMDIKADVVVIEGRGSIFKITQHLIEQGDKILGFIGDTSYCKSIEERWRGFVRAHNQAGISIRNEYCFVSEKQGHFYFGKEVENTVEIFLRDKQPLPQAFVCANDVIAYKVIKQLEEHGYKVPEDIRISGFDDMFTASRDGEQYLTSVYINTYNVGKRLAEQMIWRIHNRDRENEVIKIYGQIKFRDSTKKQVKK